MIELKNVSKSYFKHEAIKDISFSMGQGEIIGLFGENGAGKTTLMKCLFGFIKYDGSITLDGEPITRKNIERLSFATNEHSFFPKLTAAQHAEFYRENFPKFSDKRYDTLMEFFNIPKDRKLRTFSSGQQSQFEAVMALSQGADYIIMDEPFVNNDIFNREDFYKVLLGMLTSHETVLLSTHLIEEVEGFIGRALLIRGGELIDDVSVEDLDEKGIKLVDYIKNKYRYRADRVGEAIDKLESDESNSDL